MRPVLLAALAILPSAAAAAPLYTLSVRLEPAAGTLDAQAGIVVPAGEPAVLRMDGAHRPEGLTVDGQPLSASRDGSVWRIALPVAARERRIELHWQIRAPATDTAQRHRDTLTDASPRIGPAGSFLPAGGGWYPLPYDDAGPLLHRYTLEVNLPADQRALAPGEQLQDSVHDGRRQVRIVTGQESEGADLMAGPWQETSRTLHARDGRTLTVRTLFHPVLAGDADGYLDAASRQILRFEQQIGDYPYRSFSIASSPTPTGFGMAGLTYLGSTVLSLPFIRHTSLPHEVLHNWWGNGVFVAHDSGNWSEGLTTFMADHAQREAMGEDAARTMRLDWLRALSALPPAAQGSLAAFSGRTHDASQAIGYHKAALVFLMLRDRLGTADFDQALRVFWRDNRYRRAGWQDLRNAFERVSGRDLGPFFAQWVEGRGLAAPRIASVQPVAGGVELALEQPSPPYDLELPLSLRDEAGGDRRLTVTLTGNLQTVRLPLDGCADLTLDPDFRIARRLAPGEAPPILREATLAGGLTVSALGSDAGFTQMADALLDGWLDTAPQRVPGSEAPGATARIVIGTTAEVDRWLTQHGLPARTRDGDVVAWAARSAAGGTLALVAARDTLALAGVLNALPHYGSQGWITFTRGRTAERGQWPASPRSLRACPAAQS